MLKASGLGVSIGGMAPIGGNGQKDTPVAGLEICYFRSDPETQSVLGDGDERYRSGDLAS